MHTFLRPFCLFVLLTAFLCSGEAFAQMVQYGSIVELNTKGKTMSGVSITVPSAHDCQPTVSDAHGVFRLSFAEHQTGDVIYGLRAKKHGYDVVNIHVIRDGWTLTNRDTLRIVMAATEKLREARMRYYDLIETACVSRYDSTLSLLNTHLANNVITMPEYQYWKLEAEKELQHAYQNIDALSYELVCAEEETLNKPEELVADRLNSDETVLQAYTSFSSEYPLMNLDEMETKAGVDNLPVADSLYQTIMVLQTYTNLYENDFVVSGAKYAKSCAYLGAIYKEKGWGEASAKYLRKALRMYEILDLIEGVEVGDAIDKIKELLAE